MLITFILQFSCNANWFISPVSNNMFAKKSKMELGQNQGWAIVKRQMKYLEQTWGAFSSDEKIYGGRLQRENFV